jgi:hypothetical protein
MWQDRYEKELGVHFNYRLGGDGVIELRSDR